MELAGLYLFLASMISSACKTVWGKRIWMTACIVISLTTISIFLWAFISVFISAIPVLFPNSYWAQ